MNFSQMNQRAGASVLRPRVGSPTNPGVELGVKAISLVGACQSERSNFVQARESAPKFAYKYLLSAARHAPAATARLPTRPDSNAAPVNLGNHDSIDGGVDSERRVLRKNPSEMRPS